MVRNELGETSNDLSVLCKSDKINKWSKWKPTAMSGITTATDESLRAHKYGMSVPVFSTFNSLRSAIGTTPDLYTYHKPGNTFRLGDFRNYNHLQLPPVDTGVAEGEIPKILNEASNGGLTFSASVDLDMIGAIAALDNGEGGQLPLYLGAYLNEYLSYARSVTPGRVFFDFTEYPFMKDYNGIYSITLFLSTRSKDIAPPFDWFVPLPYSPLTVNAYQISIVKLTPWYVPSVTTSGGNVTITASAIGDNYKGGARTIEVSTVMTEIGRTLDATRKTISVPNNTQTTVNVGYLETDGYEFGYNGAIWLYVDDVDTRESLYHTRVR